MMDEGGARLVKGLPPCLIQPKAQVDVVERNGKALFIEATHNSKLFFGDDKASSCHGAYALRKPCALEIAAIFRLLKPMPVGGAATDPRENARMLNRSIGIEQARADGADIRSHRLTDKESEPIGIDELYVIIEEAEQLTFGTRDREIV